MAAARAILGEWLGGSGGGWQDSGGVWPGIKLIEGVAGERGRYGVRHQPRQIAAESSHSRREEVSAETRRRLQDSLVLVHGGMAQDVGPILEMVTERYLLRSEAEWVGRQTACNILDEIIGASAHRRCARDRRRHAAQFRWTDPDHHSVGEQSLYRDADSRGRVGVWRCVLGILDAGGYVGRRDGIHLRSERASRRRRSDSGIDARREQRSLPAAWRLR